MGARVIEFFEQTGFTVLLLFDVTYHLKDLLEKRREIVKQMYIAGIKTFFVCSLVGVFTGMTLALQTGIELKAFGQQSMIGRLIIATMTREMGPFMSAIILTASVGSAMAAELGTMKVYDEIDALEMMSISPVRLLVMPRVVSLAAMLPIVSVYMTVLACIGGALVASTVLQISPNVYFKHLFKGIHFKAMYVGLLKAHIFGLLIALISCAYGLRATSGVIGVGNATRQSVVASFLMVIIVGYIITAIFYGGGS
ncbi:MAG: ABC transporter permease [Spirochaetes bacterium]|nr:MAG: ABC transporter permease [Spirochaetota bacterium]